MERALGQRAQCRQQGKLTVVLNELTRKRPFLELRENFGTVPGRYCSGDRVVAARSVAPAVRSRSKAQREIINFARALYWL